MYVAGVMASTNTKKVEMSIAIAPPTNDTSMLKENW